MNILILNGLKENNQCYANVIENILKESDHKVKGIQLNKMTLNYCTGCWSCWFKTPGECCHKDDTAFILSHVIKSDLVLMLTENKMGFITSESKKMLDKFIPLIHPRMELVENEFHHLARYEKYPELGLIYLDPNKNTTDFQITKDIFTRAALNFKTTLSVAIHLNADMEEMTYENFAI